MDNSGDYISRDAAEERLLHMAEVANSAYDGLYNSQIVMLAQNVIHMLPAADVRPVRRGKWTLQWDVDGLWHCSECNSRCIYTSNFCPNCGAYMRGESDV